MNALEKINMEPEQMSIAPMSVPELFRSFWKAVVLLSALTAAVELAIGFWL